MKTYHKCDFCSFESEDMEETRLHEHACNLKSKLGFLGVEISHETAKLMWDMCLVNLSAIDAKHAEAVESVALKPDDAFGHPGRVQLWICPKADVCKGGVACGGHKVPHRHYGKACNGSSVFGCPACVEVKR